MLDPRIEPANGVFVCVRERQGGGWVTVQLICAFVFAYMLKSKFPVSHDLGQLINQHDKCMSSPILIA